jgi:hypothetical protein
VKSLSKKDECPLCRKPTTESNILAFKYVINSENFFLNSPIEQDNVVVMKMLAGIHEEDRTQTSKLLIELA